MVMPDKLTLKKNLSILFILNYVMMCGLPANVPAQMNYFLPEPGSKVLTSQPYEPLIMKGMVVYPDNPFKFDFIVDAGESDFELQQASTDIDRLIKYFLISLTIADDNFWVNLSPYENNRIIADGLNETVMGQDLLAQDYMLKQLTASLLSPDEETGQAFWEAVYDHLKDQIDLEFLSHNTLNKIWIVPGKADVYVKDQKVFITGSHLKVMLEEDYLASQKWHGVQSVSGSTSQKGWNISDQEKDISTELVKKYLLPVVEQEINAGKTFANLRQIYHAMILAAWFKENLRNNLLKHVYVGQGKTKGMESGDPKASKQIYQQYLQAYKTGVCDMIKEEYDPVAQKIIARRYFSGGVDGGNLKKVYQAQSITDIGQDSDLAMMNSIDKNMKKPYIVSVGLSDTSGQLSFKDNFDFTSTLDEKKKNEIADTLFEGKLNLSQDSIFRVLLSIPQEQHLIDNILYRSALINLLGKLNDDLRVQQLLKNVDAESRVNELAHLLKDIFGRIFQDGSFKTTTGQEFSFERQLIATPVQPMGGMKVDISMQDVGAQQNDDGEIDYQNSFQKVKELIPLLARDGVSKLYIYGGLYEIGDISKQLHQVPTAGEHFIKSSAGHVVTKIKGYRTKRMSLPGAGKDNVLYDKFGNNFSILGLEKFNPKLSRLSSDEDPQPQSAQKAEKEFKELVAFAKSFGVDIVTDFIGWLAPDAINESNYHWTSYRRVADEWTRSDWAEYLALTPAGKEQYFRELLMENDLDFVYESSEGPLLIRHFNYGLNRDQVALNAFLPEVREYYISAIKKMIDLGVTGMRADLGHYLLKRPLRDVFPDGAVHEAEPWSLIMKAVGEYAEQKGVDFTFIMETYDLNDTNTLQRIGQKAGIDVQVYHKPLEDAYINVVQDGHSARELAEEVNTVIYYAKTSEKRQASPATFDDQSLKNNGGPIDGFMKLLFVLSEFDVPVSLDLREWVLHHGHVTSMVGGRSPDGTITHPFVTKDEFNQRMQEYGLRDLVEGMNWRQFTRIIQSMDSDSPRKFILQMHEDYPWYMFDYLMREDRDRYITLGWRKGESIVFYTLDMRPANEGIAHIKIAANQFDGLTADRELPIYFNPGQESLLYSVGFNQEIGEFEVRLPTINSQDNAMLVQGEDVGGIDFNPQQLDLTVHGQGIQFADPIGIIYNQDMRVEGMVPVILNIVPLSNMPAFFIGESPENDQQMRTSLL